MSLPPKLERVVKQFSAAPRELRTEALLGYARKVPPLPPELAEHPEALEQVHECVTPFFLATELDASGHVRLYFDCPPEAPTVRGFAGLLLAGLDGVEPEEILAVPDHFYIGMGLEEVVSRQRLRGMGAILARIKKQVEEKLAAA